MEWQRRREGDAPASRVEKAVSLSRQVAARLLQLMGGHSLTAHRFLCQRHAQRADLPADEPRPARAEPLARNRNQLLAIAIVLADHFAIKQWRQLGRASLGRRLLCVLSIGVLWVRWWREILQL